MIEGVERLPYLSQRTETSFRDPFHSSEKRGAKRSDWGKPHRGRAEPGTSWVSYREIVYPTKGLQFLLSGLACLWDFTNIYRKVNRGWVRLRLVLQRRCSLDF